ncbi:MAG: tRNA nucleotidyltransferase, partial [Desulfovibrio sp.]|nr:tRNA nucleotidyltransferase [Desulfovibrio sp.]
MQILLVGGAVRNILLGLPAADKDFLVLNADEEEFLRKFPKAKQVGKSFPVFLVNGLEFSFPRRSDPAWTTMQILQADFEERDLTINAMALDQDGELYCHPQALNDLHSRTLRPAGPEAMAADPLRIFRA